METASIGRRMTLTSVATDAFGDVLGSSFSNDVDHAPAPVGINQEEWQSFNQQLSDSTNVAENQVNAQVEANNDQYLQQPQLQLSTTQIVPPSESDVFAGSTPVVVAPADAADSLAAADTAAPQPEMAVVTITGTKDVGRQQVALLSQQLPQNWVQQQALSEFSDVANLNYSLRQQGLVPSENIRQTMAELAATATGQRAQVYDTLSQLDREAQLDQQAQLESQGPQVPMYPVAAEIYSNTYVQQVIGGIKADWNLPVGGIVGSVVGMFTQPDPEQADRDPQLYHDQQAYSQQLAAEAAGLVSVVPNGPHELEGYNGSVIGQTVTGIALGLYGLADAGVSALNSSGYALRSPFVLGDSVPSAFELADSLAQSGDYESITLQRSVRTSTGRVGTSASISDVIGIQRSGLVDQFEIQSATDAEDLLMQRMIDSRATLPVANQGSVQVLPPKPPRIE